MTLRRLFGIVLTTALFTLASAAAKDSTGNSPDYLALGDSVPFGFIDQAGYNYYYPINFVSYVDWDSLTLVLNPANAACPGETTSSFLSATAPDNGCRLYRSLVPLHVIYGSLRMTQYRYATSFLQNHRGTVVVTIQLGADDLFLLEQQCNNDPVCIEHGAGQVFATAQANMQTILAGLRATGYAGGIVIVNYYSPDYSNQFVTQLTMGLNQAISAPAPNYGAVVADVFSAFQAASSNPFANGNTCVAGLLNPANPQTNPPSCDVHPSQFGHKLIAQTVAGVFPLRAKAGK